MQIVKAFITKQPGSGCYLHSYALSLDTLSLTYAKDNHCPAGFARLRHCRSLLASSTEGVLVLSNEANGSAVTQEPGCNWTR